MNSSNDWYRKFSNLLPNEAPIDKCWAEFACLEIDGIIIPSTVSQPIANNCYAVSPLSLISGYAEDELPKVHNALARMLCRFMIKAVVIPLKLAKLDEVQTLNNQCLSTNMYSSSWHTISLQKIRDAALKLAPKQALLLRSLNPVQHLSIIENAKTDGWVPIATRQVYLHCDWANFKLTPDVKRDKKLLMEEGWKFRALESKQECERAKTLYDALYLDKYSEHNIQFTAQYLYRMSQEDLIQLRGLFYQGRMVAALGMVIIDGDMTCPIFGYDTSLPSKLALYRRISIFTIEYAKTHGLNFNMSSGAPRFKTHRGAKPEIEYSYVYTKHLTWFQRGIWRLLSVLTQTFYKPLLQKYRL
ncbi:GNAT family N-acetyltransferase [Vibrio penaeicida]|uniref:GNAT family N-acetyltransferase n=1 Tax=Vibrio penaeicida TaxID=104609 RepID=A0AAV5NWN4_9VIBR|nr:GNAT family N-acetyltransferase [Vibrio penaeicida]RTZ21495.1 GNAT family N-acetyltransferase [Vibrio penaeicida]GLQ75022.1 hypothetical protein GCM10007932_43840 [Vibrio penaeicida]